MDTLTFLLSYPDHLRYGKRAKQYRAALLAAERHPELLELPGLKHTLLATAREMNEVYARLRELGYTYDSRRQRWL